MEENPKSFEGAVIVGLYIIGKFAPDQETVDLNAVPTYQIEQDVNIDAENSEGDTHERKENIGA